MMPTSFRPAFIGRLIALRDSYQDLVPGSVKGWIHEHLCTLVKQMRNYNAGDKADREHVWPQMLDTRKGLRDLGVMVG